MNVVTFPRWYKERACPYTILMCMVCGMWYVALCVCENTNILPYTVELEWWNLPMCFQKFTQVSIGHVLQYHKRCTIICCIHVTHTYMHQNASCNLQHYSSHAYYIIIASIHNVFFSAQTYFTLVKAELTKKTDNVGVCESFHELGFFHKLLNDTKISTW